MITGKFQKLRQLVYCYIVNIFPEKWTHDRKGLSTKFVLDDMLNKFIFPAGSDISGRLLYLDQFYEILVSLCVKAFEQIGEDSKVNSPLYR